MDLSEAKIILNENGYELLDEDKLGRAIGMGALALGTLFGNAQAHNYTHNFRYDSIEDIIEYKNKMDNIHKNQISVKYELKNAGFIYKSNDIFTISPIISLKKINISDNVSEISFYSYGSESGYSINIYFDDGTSKHISFEPGSFSKSQITIEDEYDNVISRKYISDTKAKNMIDKYYKDIMKTFKKDFDYNSNNYEEDNYSSIYSLSQEDLKKLDDMNNANNDDNTQEEEYTPEQLAKIEKIMAKYK